MQREDYDEDFRHGLAPLVAGMRSQGALPMLMVGADLYDDNAAVLIAALPCFDTGQVIAILEAALELCRGTHEFVRWTGGQAPPARQRPD